MNVERDILDRLDRLGYRWYVTGSWALAAYAEPRTTVDIDVVLEATPVDYATRIRDALADDFLVNDAIDLGGRWMGGAIHRTEIVRIDLIFGREDSWATSAMDRRIRREHPTLGTIWIISPEDLILAKLEWSEGTSELQLRDVASLIRLNDDLDWEYLSRYAGTLGIDGRLEAMRDH